MSRWFRHYAGMMRDDKLVSVAIKAKQPVERVVWVWGAILESAAEIDDNGRFDVDAAEIAYFLRADEADIFNVLAGLESAGRLASGRVVKWGDRQFQSDRSASRQAALRERRRHENAGSDDNQTSRNAEVTSQSRHRDAPETEAETKTESSEANASGADAVAEPANKELWRSGKALLVKRSGMTNPAAGDLIGKWVGAWGVETVLAKVRAAETEAENPKTWIAKALSREPKLDGDANETALVDWIGVRSPRMRPDERLKWARDVLKPIASLPAEAVAKGIRSAAADSPKFPGDMAEAVAKAAREYARWAAVPSKPALAAVANPISAEERAAVAEMMGSLASKMSARPAA